MWEQFFQFPFTLQKKKVFVHRLQDKIVLFGDFFFFFLDSQMFSSANKRTLGCVAQKFWRKEKASTSNRFCMFEKSFQLVFSSWEIFILLKVIKQRKVEVPLSSTSAGGLWKHHYFQNTDGISFRPKFHVSSIWQTGRWALFCGTPALCDSRPFHFPWLLLTLELLQLDETQHPSFQSSGNQTSGQKVPWTRRI